MAKRTPKAIGTAAESAAVRWLKGNGWPDTIRLEELGIKNQGDLLLNDNAPRLTAEVKAGWQTEKAGAAKRAEWLQQTEDRAVRAGADLSVLIVARKGCNPSLWDAYMPAADWALLLTGDSILTTDAPWPLRASLADWSRAAWEWADAQ